MKEINDAKDILNSYIDEYGSLNNVLKEKYFCELNEELTYIRAINNNDYIFRMYFKIDFEFLIANFYSILERCNSNNINEKYIKQHKKYNELLGNYLYWIRIKSHISPVTFKFDKIVNLKMFREKVIEHFNSLLDPVLEEFKQIEDYETFKPILLGYRNGTSTVLLWGKTDIENARKVLKKNCWNAVNSYYKRKKIVEELIEYKGEVTPNIQNLYNNILDEEAFYNRYNKLPKRSILKRIKRKLTNVK